MRKIERLRLEASEACKFRGHDMKRWYHSAYGTFAFSQCKTCGDIVVVRPFPAVYDVEIRGAAVMCTCGAPIPEK